MAIIFSPLFLHFDIAIIYSFWSGFAENLSDLLKTHRQVNKYSKLH